MEEKLNLILQMLNEQNIANQKLSMVYLTKLAVIENLLSASLMPEPHRTQSILECKALIEYSANLVKDLQNKG